MPGKTCPAGSKAAVAVSEQDVDAAFWVLVPVGLPVCVLGGAILFSVQELSLQHSAESGPVALHWCLHPVCTPVHRVLLESSGLDKPAGSRLLNQLLQRLPQISPSLGSKTLAGGAPCPSLHPKQPARQRD
ncbi:unnamed protein product [Natator depressus]